MVFRTPPQLILNIGNAVMGKYWNLDCDVAVSVWAEIFEFIVWNLDWALILMWLYQYGLRFLNLLFGIGIGH